MKDCKRTPTEPAFRVPNFGVAALIVGVLLYSTTDASTEKRRLTVADSIETTRAQGEIVLQGPEASPVVRSPDGSRYVVMLLRGDVARNGVWLELIAGGLGSLEASKPQTIIKLFTPALGPKEGGDLRLAMLGWNYPVWMGNERIAFLWNDRKGIRQIVSVSVTTRKLVFETKVETDVTRFKVSPQGAILYWAKIAKPAQRSQKLIDSGFTVTSTFLLNVMSGRVEDGNFRDGLKVGKFLKIAKHLESHQLGIEYSAGVLPVSFSPDGRWAIVFVTVDENKVIPAEWERFTEPRFSRAVKAAKLGDKETAYPIQQLYLVDLKRAIQRPLWPVPAPYPRMPCITWSSSQRSVLLTRTFVPPSQADAAGLAGDGAAEIELETGRFWTVPMNTLTSDLDMVHYQRDDLIEVESPQGNRLLFRKKDDGWHLSPDSSQTDSQVTRSRRVPSFRVELREDLNSPPALYFVDPSTKSESMIYDFNPALRTEFSLGRVERLTWIDALARTWEGVLYYPVNYSPRRRFPLVVQTHGIASRAIFSLYGINDSLGAMPGLGPGTPGYAAQVLANHDIAVLQVQDRSAASLAKGEEPKIYVAGYEGAVENLVASGLVDSSRIGLMGFSRTGWHVEYALTHSRFPFAAALVVDNMDGGYMQASLHSWSDDLTDGAIGAPPFGEGLQMWLRHAPAFNAEKVSAPLQIQTLSGGLIGVLAHWEMFSRLRKLGKPVELYVIPDIDHGAHNIQNPRQLLASQQRAVDWWRFWLSGEIDADLSKVEQYSGWRVFLEKRGHQSQVAEFPRSN